MTGGNILQRYTERTTPGSEPDRMDGDGTDDLGAFGWLRGGVRERAAMLELRQKTGNILAVSYGFLERIEFDPSKGITLYLCGRNVQIKGRNLNAEVRPNVRLFEGLTRQRVPWVQEADAPSSLLDSGELTIIEKVDWS